MKFEIMKQEDNRLLNRKQYTVKVTDITVTPKREDIWKSFSAKQGLDEKRLIVDTVFNSTGLRDVLVSIKYYDDEASLKRIELKNNLHNWMKLQGQEVPKKEKKKKAKKGKKAKK